MEIRIHNQQKRFKISKKKTISLVKKTLGRSINYDGEINIIFIDNKEIRRLNKKYLNRSYATDVIAFSYNPWEKNKEFYGDIFISVEQAQKQAKIYNNSLSREIYFLVLHGVLHLMGWEDKTASQRKRMLEKQKEILEKYEKTNSLAKFR